MCDCVVVTPEASADGVMLFAKNSDREADEAQLLEIVPATEHAPGEILRCTYVDVPQVSRTHRVLLSRPTWMWGAEIAVNDQGLAVGNEAVFTRLPGGSFLRSGGGNGLTGMDLVRLVAERAATAEAGVTLLGELLVRHGQGGPGGYRDKTFVYHNSFLLADPSEAWVVETAGVAWVAKRVRGVRAISNGITLREDYDRASPNLTAFARDLGLHHGNGRVDFQRAFADRAITFAAAAPERRDCVEGHLNAARPATVLDVMTSLRQHATGWVRNVRKSVCTHASWLPTKDQTTSSLVARLGTTDTLAFVTGTSSPCVSLFKPVWLDTGLAGYREELWWRHYSAIKSRDLARWRRELGPARDARERDLVERAMALPASAANARARETVTRDAFRDETAPPLTSQTPRASRTISRA